MNLCIRKCLDDSVVISKSVNNKNLRNLSELSFHIFMNHLDRFPLLTLVSFSIVSRRKIAFLGREEHRFWNSTVRGEILSKKTKQFWNLSEVPVNAFYVSEYIHSNRIVGRSLTSSDCVLLNESVKCVSTFCSKNSVHIDNTSENTHLLNHKRKRLNRNLIVHTRLQVTAKV